MQEKVIGCRYLEFRSDFPLTDSLRLEEILQVIAWFSCSGMPFRYDPMHGEFLCHPAPLIRPGVSRLTGLKAA